MARPADWSALGLDGDPVPGDPEQVSREAAHLSRVAATITDEVAALRKIAAGDSDGVLEGQYAGKIHTEAASVAADLNKVVGRYQRVSQALDEWVPELEYAQSRSLQALYNAQDAAHQQQAYAPQPRPADQQETAQQEQEEQTRARLLAQADSAMAAARRQLDDAVSHRDAAASRTAAKIGQAIDDGMADSWWDQFEGFVDQYAAIIKDACTALEAIATVLAVIALFIPGLDLIVMLAIAATALAMIGRTLLAATGNGSWAEVAMDAVALLTFGAGRVVGSVAEGAAAAGENLPRIAADGAEGAGKAGDLISKLADSIGDEDTAREAEEQIFRIVGPEEAADIAETGAYHNPYGLEGKYFFPTQAQAENLAGMFAKAGMGGPYTLTSGLVAHSVLAAAEEVNAAGEGLAFFLRSDQLPLITDVTIHGLLP